MRWSPRARASRFQSTRPRGARPHTIRLAYPYGCFNPHAPAGRDINQAVAPVPCPVSIHAPRGARLVGESCLASGRSFNPHAPAGRDGSIRQTLQLTDRFNPHAPRGATQINRRFWRHFIVSIHAPPRGATNHDHRRNASTWVSIHTPRGARLGLTRK